MTTCECCGATYETPDWPFCPHGRGAMSVVPDDVPGGFIAENGFETPQVFYSRQAHRDALAARGLEIVAKWAGPEDRYLTRWDTVDLDKAAALVSRGMVTAADRRAELAAIVAEFPVTVTETRR